MEREVVGKQAGGGAREIVNVGLRFKSISCIIIDGRKFFSLH